MDKMTHFNPTDMGNAEDAKGLSGKVVLIASELALSQLKADDSTGYFVNAQCHAAAPDAAIDSDWLTGAHLLVLEVDPSISASLQRVRDLRASHRNLPVIAAIKGADLTTVRTLVRQGVVDVASMPLAPAELAGQIADALAKVPTAEKAQNLAPLICVVGGTGGCGTTTVITHLASVMANTRGLRTCVVDLDLQSGEVAYYVGQSPRITVSTLIEAGERIDADFIASALTSSEHGFSLIAAPDEVTPLDEVDVDDLLAMLRIVRERFDVVLVDLPCDWTNWGLSVAHSASKLVLVTELSLACLRQSKRRLELFESVGIEPDRIALVANRIVRKLFGSVDLDDAAKALGHPFTGALHDFGHDITNAQDEGRLLFDLKTRSTFESELTELAEELLGPSK